MYDSVKQIFPSFSKKFEGYVHYMYLDIKGLVTIGIGNLIDPIGAALVLPFVHADGSPASSAEISAEWQRLKAHTELAHQGFRAAQQYCTLRLTDDGIDDLVRSKLALNEHYLIAHHFSDFENWPADAQLGVLSMAWALGAGFPATWPHFKAACQAQTWADAAANCRMKEAGNPGVIPRNNANVLLFNTADTVQSGELDKSQIQANVA
jgi:GH24 family phage-related lysozyme (muramidase)